MALSAGEPVRRTRGRVSAVRVVRVWTGSRRPLSERVSLLRSQYSVGVGPSTMRIAQHLTRESSVSDKPDCRPKAEKGGVGHQHLSREPGEQALQVLQLPGGRVDREGLDAELQRAQPSAASQVREGGLQVLIVEVERG